MYVVYLEIKKWLDIQQYQGCYYVGIIGLGIIL